MQTHRDSVPVHLVGQRVDVRLNATTVEIGHRGHTVALHRRCYERHGQVLELDHDLELLAHKPGALPRALPLSQARDARRWPPAYERLWAAMGGDG